MSEIVDQRSDDVSRLSGLHAVVVNNFPGPRMGGGEIQLIPVIQALLNEGAAVTAVAPPCSEFIRRCEALGASVVEVTYSWADLPLTVLKIQRAVSMHKSECRVVLIGTGFLTNVLVRLVKVALRRCVAVVNVVAVMPDAARFEGERFLQVLRRVIDATTRSLTDRFIAVSEAVACELASRGVPRAKVRVVRNGVDFTRLDAMVGEPIPATLPRGQPIVACIARLEPVKGVEHFVRAASLVEGATFVVAGSGSCETRLREIAERQQAGSPVLFLGDVPSVAPLMSMASIVVVPSLSEGFGLVAAEAMGLGKPVVATRVGGLPEVVVDHETGLLVPPGDARALAEAISVLLRDMDMAHRFGAAGRARARKLFDARVMAQAYVTEIRRVAGC